MQTAIQAEAMSIVDVLLPMMLSRLLQQTTATAMTAIPAAAARAHWGHAQV